MQRLFSSFARGLPGAGLLLLRLAASTSLVAYAAGAWLPNAAIVSSGLCVLMLAAAFLLALGLWTPIAGALAFLAAAWHGALNPSDLGTDILLGALGIALSLLGPGAWSVDARLFGWKRLEIQNGAADDSLPGRDDPPSV